jgi:hypothetical protein
MFQLKGQEIEGEVAGDRSGYSVALSDSGNIVAIGARRNDAGNATNDNRGRARMFEHDGSVWQQLGQDIDGVAVGDQSGMVSLSSDGLTVAVGAWTHDVG